MNRQEYPEAINDFDEALKIDPNLALAKNNRGVAYSQLKDNKEALEDFNDYINSDLDDVDLSFYNKALLEFSLEKFEDALENIDSALISEPQIPNYNFLRGIINLDLGNVDEAEQDFKKLSKIEAENDYGLALFYEKKIKSSNKYMFLLGNGLISFARRNFVRANKYFEELEIFKNTGNDYFAPFYQAFCNFEMQNLNFASKKMTDCEKIFSKEFPNKVFIEEIPKRVIYPLICFYEGLKNYSKLDEIYNYLINKFPDRKIYLLKHGILKFKEKKYFEAFYKINEYLEFDENNAEALIYKGRSQFYLNDYENAILTFKKVLESKNSRHAQALRFKGISELELFKYNDAKSSLKEAIKLSDNESLFIFELFFNSISL